MCHLSCIEFGKVSLGKENVSGKQIIEVGAFNVNGSLRPMIEALCPSSYIGVDLIAGPGVDVVCDADDLMHHFGMGVFDLLICTEMLEHVRDWKATVSNFKHILKPGGKLFVTTRSKGYPYHGAPFDCWRYELEDMKWIFSDFEIECLEPDPLFPGVFLIAKKPVEFVEADLSEYKLYSMLKWKRVATVTNFDIRSYTIRALIRHYLSRILPSGMKRAIKKAILREQLI